MGGQLSWLERLPYKRAKFHLSRCFGCVYWVPTILGLLQSWSKTTTTSDTRARDATKGTSLSTIGRSVNRAARRRRGCTPVLRYTRLVNCSPAFRIRELFCECSKYLGKRARTLKRGCSILPEADLSPASVGVRPASRLLVS